MFSACVRGENERQDHTSNHLGKPLNVVVDDVGIVWGKSFLPRHTVAVDRKHFYEWIFGSFEAFSYDSFVVVAVNFCKCLSICRFVKNCHGNASFLLKNRSVADLNFIYLRVRGFVDFWIKICSSISEVTLYMMIRAHVNIIHFYCRWRSIASAWNIQFS